MNELKIPTNLETISLNERLLGLIISALSLVFCLGSGIIKKVLHETKRKKKNITNYFIWPKIN